MYSRDGFVMDVDNNNNSSVAVNSSDLFSPPTTEPDPEDEDSGAAGEPCKHSCIQSTKVV